MKKKFFAVALATTMALSTAVTAMAETKDTLSSANPFVNTGDEKLVGDFDITYSFHTKSTLKDNWDTFAIEFYNDAVTVGDTGKGFLTLRADTFGWWAEGWNDASKSPKDVNANWKGNEAGWDNWKTDVADADVVINAKRKGETISVEYKIKGANGSSYTFTNSVENVYGFGDYVYAHLTMAQSAGVKVDLTNVKFKNNTNAGSNNNTKPSDETTTAKQEETTTEEETTTAAPAAAGKVEVTSTDAPVYDKDGNSLGNIKVDIKGAEESVQKTVLSLIDSKYTDKINTKSPVLVLDITAAQFEPADGKSVKVTYDLTNTDLKDKTDLTVYRLEADNTLKEMSNVELKDNKISFTTEHFSTYVIAQKVVKTETETTTKKEDGNKGGSTGSGDAAPIVVFVAVAVAAAGVVASRKKLV